MSENFSSAFKLISQSLIPTVTVFLLIIVSLLPFPIPYWSTIPPQLALIGVFYWSIYRPDLLPFWIVFILGIIQDSLVGFPLGVTSFVMIIVRLFIVTQIKFFSVKNFLSNWMTFIIIYGAVSGLLWLFMSILEGHMMIAWAIIFQYLITIIFYPLFSWMLYSLEKNFSTT